MTHGTMPHGMNLVILASVALVLVLRLRGLSRVRRLRLGTLWIAPAVLAAALVASLVDMPPRTPGTAIALAAALLAGAGLGWHRAKLMRLSVDPATGTLNQQASPAALLFVVLLLVARRGLRYEAATLGLDMVAASTVLLGLAAGLMAGTRVELFVRARRLLADHTLGSSIGPTISR